MGQVFDAHLHNKNHESGGFLIGLEGVPHFEGTLDNKEVMKLHDPSNDYFSFYYMMANEVQNRKRIDHSLLKYHPRREGYSPDAVDASIALNHPKVAIIDTLNEPFWYAYDYWNIARHNPNVAFIMTHSGGYLINDFLKICHFQPNVWIDFALTHTVLGGLGNRTAGLAYVCDGIRFALHSPFRNRILLGSDYPFYDQDEVFEYYSDYLNLLNDNYLQFVEENIK